MFKVTEDIIYVGVNDHEVDLFEGQYDVPNGMSYNSYVVLDEKVAVFDTVDAHFKDEWLANLEEAFAGRTPDYLVVSHLEPDHAGSIKEFADKYPEAKIVTSVKAIAMLPQFFDVDITNRSVVVKEGEPFSIGKHELNFVMAPMVHWPEVMVTYDSYDKILFSADGFGKFGTLDTDEDWACEARRYYFNIVGKYGIPVQTLLKKASTLDIRMICPLHGPVLTENLEYYIGKYQTWSSYEPEDKGVFLAYVSLHGNTGKAVEMLADMLKEAGVEKVNVADLSREDMAECIEDAFRYDRLVLAAPTYDGGLMPIMTDFIEHLRMKAYQNRKVAFIENGSWAPMAGKIMKQNMEAMKNIEIVEPMVTIRSTVKKEDKSQLEALCKALL